MGGTLGTALVMVAIIVSMVSVGVLVWHRVNAQERGDTDLERKLREDDARAEAGRRRRLGLPPVAHDGSAPPGSGAVLTGAAGPANIAAPTDTGAPASTAAHGNTARPENAAFSGRTASPEDPPQSNAP